MSSEAKNENGILWLGGLTLGIYGLNSMLKKPEKGSESRFITEDVVDGMYTFVNNPSGTYMFARTANASEPLYGHGRDPLASKLENGTYIGKLTGITFEELAQVRTNIDGSDVLFWVKKDDMRTANSNNFTLASVLNKTQSDLRNLAHSLIDKLKF